jgi:hypothetical protein
MPRSTSSSPPASTYGTRYESEKRLDVTLNTCEGVGGGGGRCASGSGCGGRDGEKRARRTTIRSSHRRAVYVRMRGFYVKFSD